ncbi:MAG: 3-isopropylmalate dehydrogenase [Dehalococcoidales bacterium]|jgi:3-isopropylmalate dehydrogenase|nr:3-isopropylmalate dehydrogenase [Dehalococcoidales bacterium]
MKFKLAVLPGDGIGPDVTTEAVKVLLAIGEKFGHEFELKFGVFGGIAIDQTGEALPKETVKICKAAQAVLLGAVGGPKWDDPQAKVRPEDGLLGIRKNLGLFANLRPVKLFPMLVDSSNLKEEVVSGVDFIFVRELTGGLYFGKPKKRWQTSRGRKAVDTMAYSEPEIERIVRVGFELARSRGKKLISVDKANVLESSRLWRQVTMEIAKDYPDIELEHMLVDTCAMRLIQNPKSLGVVVTGNMFGDILTDEASVLGGSMGMLPSASLAGVPQDGGGIFGLYEPIHGSAPDIAGMDIANPLASILSLAMMLRYSLALSKEAHAVEEAVEEVLNSGYRNYDIMSQGKTQVGTREMGDLIAGAVGGR